MVVPRTAITGLVLAGGRGSRMGGVDKGLQHYGGTPLAQHALMRLLPQVGQALLNANRNLDVYRSMGVPVWPDEVPDYPGPLAGMLSGLAHCETPYLVTVPCDAPNYPLDLVSRLAQGLCELNGELAMAYTRAADQLFPQPVFILMHVSLQRSLRDFIAGGQRKTILWAGTHRSAKVVFDDEAEFSNLNTLIELDQLQSHSRAASVTRR
jgi:molybdopterin-guanine dinucleotide biosynthesis protein A